MYHRHKRNHSEITLTSRRNFLISIAAISLSLYGCSKKESLENINGLDLSDSGIGSDFLLNGTDGKQHSLSDFKGKVVMIFFGFTHCPDVCPTALFRAAQIKESLGKDGEKLQVLFMTIDPERDKPETLKEYVRAFDPSFLGLYADAEQTAKTAKEFKAYYAKVPTGSSYTMDHSAMTYVYDRSGNLRVGLYHTQTDEEYEEDIRQVLSLS